MHTEKLRGSQMLLVMKVTEEVSVVLLPETGEILYQPKVVEIFMLVNSLLKDTVHANL